MRSSWNVVGRGASSVRVGNLAGQKPSRLIDEWLNCNAVDAGWGHALKNIPIAEDSEESVSDAKVKLFQRLPPSPVELPKKIHTISRCTKYREASETEFQKGSLNNWRSDNIA